MDTKEFDERNFAKSRAVCEAMAEYYLKDRVHETWYKEESELYKLLDECGSVENIRKRLMPEGMEWPKVDGKPVDFTTGYSPSLGVLEAVEIYNNGSCTVMSHDGIVAHVSDIHIVKPEPQDSWERLEEDAIADPYLYCEDHGLFSEEHAYTNACIARELFVSHLINRAKALAEKDRP